MKQVQKRRKLINSLQIDIMKLLSFLYLKAWLYVVEDKVGLSCDERQAGILFKNIL